MPGRHSLSWIAALLAIVATPLLAADPDWMKQVASLLAKPDGPAAVAYLKSLPLETRQTPDCVWLAARAHMAANEPENAAIHVATYRLLSKARAAELLPVQDWLCQQAELAYKGAVDAWKSGDKDRAGELYFTGLLCNQAILGRDDRGIAPRALTVLDRAIRNLPQRTRLWFALGFYHYHFSQLDAAEKALSYYLQKETDPYKKWVVGVWLSRTQAERELQKSLNEQDAQRRAAQAAEQRAKETAAAEAARRLEADDARLEELDRRAQERARVERRRQALEEDIRWLDHEIATLQRERIPRVGVGIYGDSIQVSTVPVKLVKQQIEALTEKRQKLQEELDSFH